MQFKTWQRARHGDERAAQALVEVAIRGLGHRSAGGSPRRCAAGAAVRGRHHL